MTLFYCPSYRTILRGLIYLCYVSPIYLFIRQLNLVVGNNCIFIMGKGGLAICYRLHKIVLYSHQLIYKLWELIVFYKR